MSCNVETQTAKCDGESKILLSSGKTPSHFFLASSNNFCIFSFNSKSVSPLLRNCKKTVLSFAQISSSYNLAKISLNISSKESTPALASTSSSISFIKFLSERFSLLILSLLRKSS